MRADESRRSSLRHVETFQRRTNTAAIVRARLLLRNMRRDVVLAQFAQPGFLSNRATFLGTSLGYPLPVLRIRSVQAVPGRYKSGDGRDTENDDSRDHGARPAGAALTYLLPRRGLQVTAQPGLRAASSSVW